MSHQPSIDGSSPGNPRDTHEYAWFDTFPYLLLLEADDVNDRPSRPGSAGLIELDSAYSGRCVQ